MLRGTLIRNLATVAVSLLVVAAACSDGDTVPFDPTTAATTGNTGGSMGGASAGGDDSSAAAGGSEPECPHTGDPFFDPTSLPTCEGFDFCRCLPNALVPPDNLDDLADCDADNKCVPDLLIETGGNFIAKTCASAGGFEGRCLSSCLPAVAERASQLPQDICDPGELCTPCYDPFNGEETGACSQSCDPGPTEPPGQFPRCCADRGNCIPDSLIPEEQQGDVDEDTCTGNAELCVPDGFEDDTFVAMPCSTFLGSGACLPDCLPAVDNFLIGQGDCLDGEKCAPCTDPLSGDPTGACDFLP